MKDIFDVNNYNWIKLPTWDAWEAIMLFCGMKPDDHQFFYQLIETEDWRTPQDFNASKLLLAQYPAFKEYAEIMKRAIGKGDLNQNAQLLSNPYLAKGEPQEFLKIALKYKLDIPKDLISDLCSTLEIQPEDLIEASAIDGAKKSDHLSAWELVEEVTVTQAALLILNLDPHGEEYYDIERLSFYDTPKDYETLRKAIQNAIIAGSLPAKIKHSAHMESGFIDFDRFYSEEEIVKLFDKKRGEHIFINKNPDWRATTISTADLTQWLEQKNTQFSHNFFFRNKINDKKKTSLPAYLDKSHRCYSSKLAAAIHAWLAASQNEKCLKRETTPKQFIEDWIGNNYQSYPDLIYKGRLNSTGKEDVSKVANWNVKGGSTKTPE